MQRLHKVLGQGKALYLVLLPALAMWGMRDIIDDNGIFYFFGGLFCVALYLGVATELTGLLHTVRQQALDLFLTLCTVLFTVFTFPGQQSLAVIWLYEVAGVLLAIFLLMAAKQPLERLANKVIPHQAIHMPHGGFPGWGICVFFLGIAAVFFALYWPLIVTLQPLIAVLLILWSGMLNTGRIMFAERQKDGEGLILLGVFAWIVALICAVIW